MLERERLGVTKVVIDVLNGVTEVAPVRTGRYRANWVVDYNDTNREPFPNEPFPANPEIPNLSDSGFSGQIWLVDNVPYAGELEKGHSGQAPQGVVRPTLNRLGLKGTFEGE